MFCVCVGGGGEGGRWAVGWMQGCNKGRATSVCCVVGPPPPHPTPHPPPAARRRSLKGRRFQIGRATLFNVEAPSGALLGQAVTIREWQWEDDGTKVRAGVRVGCGSMSGVGWSAVPGHHEFRRHLGILLLLFLPPQGGEDVDSAAAVAATAAAAAAAAVGGAPSPEDLAAAEAAIAEQGALVRWARAHACRPRQLAPGRPAEPLIPCFPPALLPCRVMKEERGLGNESDEVQAAVGRLLEAKAALAALQAAASAAVAGAATS